MFTSCTFLLSAIVLMVDAQEKLPNVDFLGHGYDVIFSDPHGQTTDPGFRQKIFAFTYNSNALSGDGKWHVPDNTQALPTMSCSYSANATTVQGTQSFTNSLLVDVTVASSWRKNSFTASSSYKSVKTGTSQYKTTYMETVAKCTHYSIAIDAYIPFSVTANFVAAVKSLPTGRDEAQYSKFIRTFGTHYITSMKMGAKAVVRSTVEQMAWSKMDMQSFNVKTGAEASFLGFTGSLSTATTEEKESAKTFEENRSSDTEFYLGSKPSTDGRWETWAQASGQSPMPISYVLKQVSDLLTTRYLADESESELAAKKANLEYFYTEYCNDNPVCDMHSPDFLPVRMNQLNEPIKGTQTVICRPGYSLLSCGQMNYPVSVSSEKWRRAIPKSSSSCECYDHFGMQCSLWCSNAAKGFSIVSHKHTTSSTYSVSCPSGAKVLGCHIESIGGKKPEGWRKMYPNNDGKGCTFYDHFGSIGHVTCATNIYSYEVRKSHSKGRWTVSCSEGNFVLGCGINPSGDKPEGWREWYVSGPDSCTCYDHFGATCYATCGRFN